MIALTAVWQKLHTRCRVGSLDKLDAVSPEPGQQLLNAIRVKRIAVDNR